MKLLLTFDSNKSLCLCPRLFAESEESNYDNQCLGGAGKFVVKYTIEI